MKDYSECLIYARQKLHACETKMLDGRLDEAIELADPALAEAGDLAASLREMKRRGPVLWTGRAPPQPEAA